MRNISRGFRFLKHKKILELKSSISWNISNFFRGFFLFFELGLKSAPGSPIVYYLWRPCQFFDVVLFRLSSLVLVQASCQYHHWFWNYGNYFIQDWPETWKLKKKTSEFCSISEDWGKLVIPNLAQMSLIKCY